MIYRTDSGRRVFLSLLGELETKFGVRVLAYVLMGNHYHLILDSLDGRVAQAMHFLDGNYARWFNAVHDRSGALFQGRYDDRLIHDDAHFERAGIYLHLNPLRARLVDDPARYRWSSLGAYASGRSAVAWLRLGLLRGRTGPQYLDDVLAQVDAVLLVEESDDDIHAWCSDAGAAAEAALATSDRAVALAFGVSINELYVVGRGRPNIARTAAIAAAADQADRPLADVARRYGLRSVNGIYSARRRLAEQAARDPRVAAALSRLDGEHRHAS